MTVRTPSELRALIPVSQTPSPGKVYAAHVVDIIDSFDFLTATPILSLTASHTAVLSPSQTGFKFVFTSATDVSLTLPATTPVGFQGLILQAGAGAVSLVGGTLLSRESHTKTAGAGAQAYFFVYENAGSAPKIAFSGDTAP